MVSGNGTQVTLESMLQVVSCLVAYKPGDRSEQDRAWAVCKTEMEKVVAYFATYVAEPGLLDRLLTVPVLPEE